MKRMAAFLMAAALAASLTACGGDGESGGSIFGGGVSAEEMLETAQAVDINELNKQTLSDLENAKSLYCGKTLEITSQVESVAEDHVTFNGLGVVFVDCFLPQEQLSTLQPGQRVTIVGMAEDEIETSTGAENGTGLDTYRYKLQQAQVTADQYDYRGTVVGANPNYENGWNVSLGSSNMDSLVYFAEGTDGQQYVGKTISFKAKNIDGKYYDAVVS